MKKSYKILALFACTFIFVYSDLHSQSASTEKFELTGNVSFDISSKSGLVRSIAVTVGNGGNGPYKAIMLGDTTLCTHTIFRPSDLTPFGSKEKLPIVIWANGGCRNSAGEFRNFLSEIASNGFLILAIGPVNNTLTGGGEIETGTTDSRLIQEGIDWAIAENGRKGSSYYNKVMTDKIAVMGQSCGGIQALDVLTDSRVTTLVIWNSGLFSTPPVIPSSSNTGNAPAVPRMNLPNVPKSDLMKLHCPIAYFVGGEFDMATINASDDFSRINKVPALLAKYDFSEKVKETGNKVYGHYPATYREPNGGDFAIAGTAWLNWQLKGDKDAAGMFTGQNYELLNNKHWSVQKKNIE